MTTWLIWNQNACPLSCVAISSGVSCSSLCFTEPHSLSVPHASYNPTPTFKAQRTAEKMSRGQHPVSLKLIWFIKRVCVCAVAASNRGTDSDALQLVCVFVRLVLTYRPRQIFGLFSSEWLLQVSSSVSEQTWMKEVTQGGGCARMSSCLMQNLLCHWFAVCVPVV